MFSCREAAELLVEGKLKFTQRVGLGAHLIICSRCRALKKQLIDLHLGLTRYLNRTNDIDPELTKKIIEQQLKK